MILWMALGVCLIGFGGGLLAGLSFLHKEMETPVLVIMLIIITLMIYGGYSMFSSNLLAASTVLE